VCVLSGVVQTRCPLNVLEVNIGKGEDGNVGLASVEGSGILLASRMRKIASKRTLISKVYLAAWYLTM
jgi:hypothetical protein